MLTRNLVVLALLSAGVHALVAPAVHTRRPSAGAHAVVRVAHTQRPLTAPRQARVVVSVLAEDATTPKAPEPPLEAQTLLYLVGAAALWGTYPTCVKLLYVAGPALDPSLVVLVRFLIMAAVGVSVLLATTPKFTLLKRYKVAEGAASMPWAEQIERRVPSSVYLAAFELGVLGGLGTFFQTLSLSQIPALTAAVLYSTVNAITPALASVAGANPTEREVSSRTWAGCLLGLVASSWSLIPDAGGLLPTALPTSVGQGEAVMLVASCCYAATKVRLSSHLRYHNADEMAVGRLVAQAGCALAGLGLIDETMAVHELLPETVGGLGEPVEAVFGELVAWASALTPLQLALLLASSLLSGAGATWFQSNGQRRTSAPKAQLWFATTPVFGAFWAFIFLGEQFTYHEISGAALLICGIALSVPAPSSPAAE